MFEHCADSRDAWHTFYVVACLCHPSQGGREDDMRALCASAKAALGNEWPEAYDQGTPALFDIFCRATGTPHPGAPHPVGTTHPGATHPGSAVAGYAPCAPFAAVSPLGRVWSANASVT